MGKTVTLRFSEAEGQILDNAKAMNLDQVSKDKALQSMASMSSAQIVSASVLQNKFSPPSPLPQAVFSTSSRVQGSWEVGLGIKPFAQPAYPVQPPLPPTLSTAASVPVWQDRTIASSRLRLLEYSAFMEVQRDPDTYSKHLFVHIGQTNPAFSDPPLEAVDVRQIYDKFPEKKGGLKELYEKGPPNAFFLVKFWVSCPGPSLLPRVPPDVRCTQAYPTTPSPWACGHYAGYVCPQSQGGRLPGPRTAP
ncbi:transcriptional enhancer factor TEF-5 [Pontoporia blainvillei]|uniref:Transcriptional enhancer factor TEF-5 n=1 Tax=Pontoporia blainvillei TaxID=48723 RepID=A0ABX0S0Y4_PONBL|nr:transcriptional enhancer factor TEF-5 [Pontoporia blainvillei]